MTKSRNEEKEESKISTQISIESSSMDSGDCCKSQDTDKVLDKEQLETENTEQKTLIGRLEIEDGRSLGQSEIEDVESPAIGVAFEMDPELKGLMDEYELNDDDLDPEKSGGAVLQIRDTQQMQLSSSPSICALPYRIGRCVVLFPYLYKKTGYGIVGAHFCPGVLVTILLLSSLSYFFIELASKIGNISFFISCGFAFVSHISLMFVCFTDPGIINPKGCRSECMKYCTLPPSNQSVNGKSQTYRFCGFCNVYQPKSARHCQDCGVCVIGFDHHCPWMGICIGRYNMKAFVIFNFSWLLWLIYGVGWIATGSKVRDAL